MCKLSSFNGLLSVMVKTRTGLTLLVLIFLCFLLLRIDFNLTFFGSTSRNSSRENKVFDCITWKELPFGSKNNFIKNVNMNIQNDSENHLHRLKSWIKVVKIDNVSKSQFRTLNILRNGTLIQLEYQGVDWAVVNLLQEISDLVFQILCILSEKV